MNTINLYHHLKVIYIMMLKKYINKPNIYLMLKKPSKQ